MEREEFWAVCLSMAVTAGLLIALFYPLFVHARELYPGQYANQPKEVREWFLAQTVPSGPEAGKSCCSQADGVTAQEDMREGHYWVKFETTTGPVDWMPVPDHAVLLGPNMRGTPVVWYFYTNGKANIRCFAPGSGV